MRLKPSHAARSGVGEHTARESESAQCVRLGRERGELPPPSLALEPHGSGAFLFSGETVFPRGALPAGIAANKMVERVGGFRR
jgi:hypothetical protein